MGKIIKKGTKGSVQNYITRNKALKKLQLSLPDFRRLCILKGIYPREPRNKKKLLNGSTAPTTFYYVKDLMHLLHDPLIVTFRQQKTVEKKIAKALAKGEREQAKRYHQSRPQVSLDHVIRERYPTFIDAVRDLDDALCMVYLFSMFPQTDKVKSGTVAKCAQLCREFEHAVIRQRSVKKAFLSIKGVYYQAELYGQTVNWIAPYEFVLTVPEDVDFRVMMTFLDFNMKTLEFVLFRMYKEMNLQYPLKLNSSADVKASGLNSWVVENKPLFEQPTLQVKKIGANAAQVEAVQEKIAKKIQEKEESDEEMADAETESDLFEHQVFFISREVQKGSFDFLIRSFGGKVGWAPWMESKDESITHVILDRPMTEELRASFPADVVIIQPQYIFDCINAKTLLPYDRYAPGKELPAHLSPFEEPKDGDYVPEEAQKDQTADSKKENDEEKERREMAIGMMSKKDKKLYDQIQHGKKKREVVAEKLKEKKLKNKK